MAVEKVGDEIGRVDRRESYGDLIISHIMAMERRAATIHPVSPSIVSCLAMRIVEWMVDLMDLMDLMM